MTLNGAIMQLVELRENSMMPGLFKPALDKVIETVSDCEEPKMKPIFSSDGFANGNPVYDFATCPRCEYQYEDTDKVWGEPFCPHCGAALDWSEVL